MKVTEKNIVPADWLRINGTKTYYRFRSPSLQKKIQELEQAREVGRSLAAIFSMIES